jgi:hypothetical protein
MREKLFSGGYREIHKRRETKQKAKKQAPQWEAAKAVHLVSKAIISHEKLKEKRRRQWVREGLLK